MSRQVVETSPELREVAPPYVDTPTLTPAPYRSEAFERPQGRSLRRTLGSFAHAWRGIRSIARTEPNFVVHLGLATVAFGLGVLLGLTPPELAILVVAIAVVLAAEAMNTAIEALCDLVSPGYHPLVKRAKDTAAGSVLLAAMGAALVGLVLLAPRLVALLLSR